LPVVDMGDLLKESIEVRRPATNGRAAYVG
jgi:hypothetical protein